MRRPVPVDSNIPINYQDFVSIPFLVDWWIRSESHVPNRVSGLPIPQLVKYPLDRHVLIIGFSIVDHVGVYRGKMWVDQSVRIGKDAQRGQICVVGGEIPW